MTLREIVDECWKLERSLSRRQADSPATVREVEQLSSLLREAVASIVRAAEVFKGNGDIN
jgi:hypothetical protein